MCPVGFYIGQVVYNVNRAARHTKQNEANNGVNQVADYKKLAIEQQRHKNESILDPLMWTHRFEETNDLGQCKSLSSQIDPDCWCTREFVRITSGHNFIGTTYWAAMERKPKRIRLDILVTELGLYDSREQARRHIMAGDVMVNNETVFRPSLAVSSDAQILIKAKPQYVSRGGYKLEAALARFGIVPDGWVCADVGASTGGFTDCLLQNGAHRVYAIDVGYGQLDWRLRSNSKVVPIERTNARYLRELPEPIQLVVVDVSFISIKHILPQVYHWLAVEPGYLVALIKPQFEAGRHSVGKGGVIRDPEVHRQVLWDAISYAGMARFQVRDLVASPILGSTGNKEFLMWLGREGMDLGANEERIRTVVEEALLSSPVH